MTHVARKVRAASSRTRSSASASSSYPRDFSSAISFGKPPAFARSPGIRAPSKSEPSADPVDPDPIGDVIEVIGDRGERRVLVGRLVAKRIQEADVEIDADDAVRVLDRIQLLVGQVTRRGAQRMQRRNASPRSAGC